MKRMKKTELALLGRGFDIATVQGLVSRGYSLTSLLQKKEEELKELGIPDHLILKILTEKRPPIPEKVLFDLLHRSAHTCCVCRDKVNPIIVHHIEEWYSSRDHSINNLAVLCLHCHNKAHSTSKLSINLTPNHIRTSRDEWEQTVRNKEAEAIFTTSPGNLLDGYWDYFNHGRILETAYKLGIDPKKISGFAQLFALGGVNPDGSYRWSSMAPPKDDITFMYDGGVRQAAYCRLDYFAQLLKEILRNKPFIDLSDNFTGSGIRSHIGTNDIVTVTGGHRFKCLHKMDRKGPGQWRTGTRQGNGLRLRFDFDAWETTSSSSHGSHLRRMWLCTSVSIVRGVHQDGKITTLDCSCLAIGTGFTNYRGKIPLVAYQNVDEDEWDAVDY